MESGRLSLVDLFESSHADSFMREYVDGVELKQTAHLSCQQKIKTNLNFNMFRLL